jgi:hypothetical protein
MSQGYPYHGNSPKWKMGSLQASTCGSEVDVELVSVGVGSGYEGGQSDDASSICELPALPQAMPVQPWVVLRVLPGQVDLYFQLRGSEVIKEAWQEELDHVLEAITSILQQSCHRTNQWLLMKEMLDTRTCSPYLMSQSASEAWVEDVVAQHSRGEIFRAQEFHCDLVDSFNITPHWRIKDMKGAPGVLL